MLSPKVTHTTIIIILSNKKTKLSVSVVCCWRNLWLLMLPDQSENQFCFLIELSNPYSAWCFVMEFWIFLDRLDDLQKLPIISNHYSHTHTQTHMYSKIFITSLWSISSMFEKTIFYIFICVSKLIQEAVKILLSQSRRLQWEVVKKNV